MKIKVPQPVLPALMLPFLATTGFAQQMTGQSHPDQLNDGITTSAQTDHYVKPSHAADTPAYAPVAQAPAQPAYQNSYPATAPVPDPVLLTRDPASAQPQAVPAPIAVRPSAYPAVPVETAAVASPATEGNDDGIVLDVPTRPHELNSGTLLKARLRETIATQSTAEGTIFTAELLSDVGHHGEVMLPAGSLIRGRVSSIHGGKRISGGASIHLEPETISLPDGTLYNLRAQITDLNSTEDIRVTDEGTVVARSHPKVAAGVIGGVTATAAVTGAMIGGGVGAAVGATVGAGIATATWLKRDVQESLPAGTDVIFALDQPLTITPR